MRILWFSVTPSLFYPHSNSHNGGGWIASLEQIVRKEPTVELGIAFNFKDSQFKYVNEGVSYYPISAPTSSSFDRLFHRTRNNSDLKTYKRIIDDFKPDLIQIFGSENDFGRICSLTNIPVVIHIQGCLPPYHNALFPIGMNQADFYLHGGLTWHRRLMGLRSESAFSRRAAQEIHTIQQCRYFMGRTQWDKNLIDLFHPGAQYFHCEEALRDSFIGCHRQWALPDSYGHVKMVSVISNPWYKGVDLILKTARLLATFTDLKFEWCVYGVSDIRFYEKKYKIQAKSVNIKVMGTASKDELVEALCNATCYVHPSYIDNSPNSLCEAQYLGVPVLATHVGGISSLVSDGVSGLLFPANAPYTLASLIKQVVTSPQLAVRLGNAARKQAMERHNPEKIRQNLIHIYRQILGR